MGIYIIRVPDIGEGIAEVEIAGWHAQVGDAVAEDQVIADIMTDKATVEVPCHVHGKVVALGGKVGDVLAVGAELVRLEVEGEVRHLIAGRLTDLSPMLADITVRSRDFH